MKKKMIIVLYIIIVIWVLAAIWLINNIIKQDSSNIYAATQTKTQEDNLRKHYEYYLVMKENWFYDEEISLIKDYCKKVPEWDTFHHCLALTTSIKVSENGKELINKRSVAYSMNNLFSFKENWHFKEYNSRLESIDDFFISYNEYWYKNNCTEMLTKSNYTDYSEDWRHNCLYTFRTFDKVK